MAKKGDTDRMPMALYRTYRPSTFAEVRGQEQIVSVLEAAVKKDEVAHAYLFAGSRGTGKTSTARLLAKALYTDEQDIYEMDAASNRGIDEIRELREGVATLPFNSRYKFYIIDEAHALTRDAWSAFLKTLEEPPAHVIFVLATTELDRVPETIISRCQVFQFKKPPHEVLKKFVTDVAKKEGVVIEPAGAELVALVGEGSFRDALSILQKVLTLSSDKKLTEAEVGKVVGAPTATLVVSFLEALAAGDVERAIKAFHTSVTEGAEPKVFLLLVINRVRAVLLMRFAPKMEHSLEEQLGKDSLATLKELAGAKGAAINSSMLAELLTAYLETGRAVHPMIPLELALYRLFG
ncbi:MAG: DNA polymerase III subunit gamma/tau [Patescibacteria group bacterium]|nr:DNA polymerase III subunit gamma/tau [Patescibacteria group bacterium]